MRTWSSCRALPLLLSSLLLAGCDALLSSVDGGIPETPNPSGAWPAGRVVSVDLGRTDGPVRDVFGVNKAPLLAPRSGARLDGTKLYQAFGISQARLHDVGVDPCTLYSDATVTDLSVSPPVVVQGCSFSNIVKRRAWTVNDASKVDDPAHYDFSKLDQLLAAASRSGARIYLRIGASDYGGPNDTGDVASYARVSINIYRHVIGQFKAGPASYEPAFVEVGNEPDGAFWRGDRADFVEAYKLMVDGVRSAAASAGKSVLVGGPGFTHSLLESFTQAGNVANGFIGDVTTARLDFFSAHHYDDCSAATLPGAASWLTSLRTQMASRGASTSVPLHLTEWNIGLGNECAATDFSSSQSQSWASGFLTLLQDDSLNVGAAHFYSGMPPMSLFASSAAGTDGLVVNPSAWALRAHAGLRGGTKVKAEVCASSASCTSGLGAAGAPLLVLAGKVASGHRVLVTNDSGAEVPFTLRVAGLSAASSSATVRRLPSTALEVAGTVTGNVFTPSDAGMATLLAAETATATPLSVSGGSGTVALSAPARSLLVVDLP